jgi:hypothetical protein
LVPVANTESAAVLNMIERAARDPAVDIDKLQKLMELRTQTEVRQSERAFAAEMTVAQSEMVRVSADANNPQTRSKYASYAALDRAIRPIYTKHNLSLSFNTEDGAPPDYLRIVCYVEAHGHTRKYKLDMPADGKGAKGGDVMTKTHATGAGITYGRRYLLGMIFNLVIGEDDDGNRAGAAPPAEYTPPPGSITQDQADAIRDALDDKGASRPAFLQWAKQKRVEDIPAEHFDACMTAISNFRKV